MIIPRLVSDSKRLVKFIKQCIIFFLKKISKRFVFYKLNTPTNVLKSASKISGTVIACILSKQDNMKRLILVACIAVIAIVSCRKENTGSNTNICKTATVRYGGDPNTDGLGWILVTNTTTWEYEAPENLDASFKTEGLVVDVCYYKTDMDFICLCPPPVKKIVHITSIKVH